MLNAIIHDMKEVDFDFLIEYLEHEIARLNNFKNIENLGNVLPDISVQMVNVQISYLSNLLEYVKSAVRVERDKIQGAKDHIDATMYALMGKTSINVDDDFKKMLSNLCKRRDATVKQHEENIDKDKCLSMAESLEKVRCQLKSRDAGDAAIKMRYMNQEEILGEASKMLRTIGSEKI